MLNEKLRHVDMLFRMLETHLYLHHQHDVRNITCRLNGEGRFDQTQSPVKLILFRLLF